MFLQVKYRPDGPDGEEVEIDFTPPFARVPMIATLEKVLDVKFPPADKLDTSEANAILSQLCTKHEVILLFRKLNSRICLLLFF